MAKNLVLSFLVMFSSIECMLAQDDKALTSSLKALQASAYRCLANAKTDSALIYTDKLLVLSKSKSEGSYLQAQQFSYAAYMHEQLGNPANSYVYADSASQIFIENDSINAALANSLWTKGTSLLRLGDYLRAQNNLEHALTVAVKNKYYVNNIKNDLADSYYLMGDLPKAKHLYKELLETTEELSPLLKLIINANMTDIYLNENDIQNASQMWEPVESIISQGHLDDSPKLAELLNIKANLLRASNDYSGAFQTIEKAISSHKRINPQNLRDLVKLYCQKTEFAIGMDQDKAAEESIHLANKIVLDNPGDFTEDPYNMVVHHLMGKVKNASSVGSKEAIGYFKKAQSISDKIRLNMLHQKSKLGLAEYLYENTALGLDAVFAAFSNTQDKTLLNEAFFFIDKSQNQILLDEMSQRVWSQKNALSIIEEIKRLEINANQQNDPQTLNSLDFQIEAAKQKLRDEFGASYTEIMLERDLSTLERTARDSEMSVMMFGEGTEYSYVLLVEEEGVQMKRLNVKNDVLKLSIMAHNKLLANRNTRASEYTSSAYALYETLFSKLEINKKNLCVIPNRILNELSFSSLLLDEKNGETYNSLAYLSNKYILQYALSSYFLGDRIYASGKAMAIVDRESTYGSLESHYEMLNATLSKFGANIYEATEQNAFNKESTGVNLLHISSHGFYDTDDAMESYINLPGNKDFKCRIKDIYNISFAERPLIVLNSCETAKGHELKGEGSNNFTRAFSYAGAGAVIESAWKINAFTTSEIFRHYYNYVIEGEQSTDALSKSLAAFRAQTNVDDSFFHPYYWSGFKHYGNAVIIEKPNPITNIVWVVASLFILALIWFFFKKKRDFS